MEWNDMLLIHAFLAGWREQSRPEIFIGISRKTWDRFIEAGHPLDEAYAMGKQMCGIVETVPQNDCEVELSHRDYVYGNLPPHIQKYWDELEGFDPSDHRGMDKFIADRGEGFRKAIFIHAMTDTWDTNQAMRRAGVSRSVINKWRKEDDNFREILKDLVFYKGNHFEKALVDKVAEGDTSAIIFANKTQNRDRGYADVSKIEHTHEVSTESLDLTKLGLEPAILTTIVKAIADKKRNDRLEDELKTLDARRIE